MTISKKITIKPSGLDTGVYTISGFLTENINGKNWIFEASLDVDLRSNTLSKNTYFGVTKADNMEKVKLLAEVFEFITKTKDVTEMLRFDFIDGKYTQVDYFKE